MPRVLSDSIESESTLGLRFYRIFCGKPVPTFPENALVSRFRSSLNLAAHSDANFGTEGHHALYLTCSSTNHFLSLSEHFSAWPGSRGAPPEGRGKVQWPAPPQLPFCAAENFKSRRKFIFLAVTA